jgi:DNA-binding transcriptional regulator YhcF (GntR family)
MASFKDDYQTEIQAITFEALRQLSEFEYFFTDHVKGAVVTAAIPYGCEHNKEVIDEVLEKVIDHLPNLGYTSKEGS